MKEDLKPLEPLIVQVSCILEPSCHDLDWHKKGPRGGGGAGYGQWTHQKNISFVISFANIPQYIFYKEYLWHILIQKKYEEKSNVLIYVFTIIWFKTDKSRIHRLFLFVKYFWKKIIKINDVALL